MRLKNIEFGQSSEKFQLKFRTTFSIKTVQNRKREKGKKARGSTNLEIAVNISSSKKRNIKAKYYESI